MSAALDALDELRTPGGWLLASSGEGRFASLFGRDALVASLQVLAVDPSVADATLEVLGRELGRTYDPVTCEEPGRVLHEWRRADLDAYIAHGWPVRDGELRYYGSVDAGCWFLVVAAALVRAGVPGAVARHGEAAGRVAEWLARRPMPLHYEGVASGGLLHQWWRDTAGDRTGDGHGVFDDDGWPLGSCVAAGAVQALAWRALTEHASVFADPSSATAAARARRCFDACFLAAPAPVGVAGATRLAARRLPAFAVEGERTVHTVTSDLGHLLWTGVLDDHPAVAERAAEALASPELATPYGLRTLATTNPAFDPSGYHSGSIWPWDTWVGAGGLDAVAPGAGRPLADGVMAALADLGGYPECYAVGADGGLCRVREANARQAWTVGAAVAIDNGWDGRGWAR